MIEIYILLAALGIMAVSLVGIITTAKTFGGWAERNLKYLTTFATGVFVVVAYNLVVETFHSSIEAASIFGIIAFGVLAAYLVDKAIPYSHHHHDDSENPDAHSKSGAHRIIFSDALHNITDGFLIVPAFLIDVRLGLLTALGVIVHEVAQEISEFFVLKSAGYSTKKALLINFATSSTVILGAGIALFVTNVSENLISVLLGVSAGIIIFTIFKDLVPHSFQVAQRDNTFGKHLLAAAAGIIIIASVSFATSGLHIHHSGETSHDHTEQHSHSQHDHDHPEDEHVDADHPEEGEENHNHEEEHQH